MELSQREREDLARRIVTERLGRYRGNRKAAYTAAGVNSNTWTRAEEAKPLAERSLVAIVSALWPETGGDWQRLDPPLAANHPEDLATAISKLDLGPDDVAVSRRVAAALLYLGRV